ncbi:MAG: hypothetical protein HRU15_04190 [Planctomycetes bacterium]|nr:hypothetical protein [Planctomycetota bacterium]
MYNKVYFSFIAVCMGMCLQHVASAQEVIVAEPILQIEALADHEKAYQKSDLAPGMRVWDHSMTGKLRNFATTESVGDGAGMIIHVPAGEKGRVIAYDTAARGKDLEEYQGLSFWVKGDGSDAQGVLGWNWNTENPFSFPLTDKQWHKVYVPWSGFGKDFKGKYFINYTITREDTSKANWYIIDRLHFYKEEKTEKITATANKDLPGKIPVQQFIDGRKNIAGFISKLKAKEDVTLAIIGDSITCGAQLWYIPKATTKDYYYPVVAARGIAKHFGYEGEPCIIYETFDKEKGWSRIMGEGATPGKGLTVVVLGAGGKQTPFALEHMDKLLSFNPAYVHSQYGVNDIPFGTIEDYVSNTQKLVQTIQEKGIAISIGTPTSDCGLHKVKWMNNDSLTNKGLPYCVETRKIAATSNCALVDMRKAFDARGIRCLGDLYSDQYHPNHRGHRIMAKALQALFTEEELLIWENVPTIK